MAVEKDELDNLFTDSDKDKLERLKVDIKENYYSVASIPVEIDWEMCKGFARETGVSDEYLAEANLNRALKLALEDIASDYTKKEYCFVYVKDGLIHVGTNVAEYEDTAEENLETIGKLTLEKDDLGILRLYVSGEMQDEMKSVRVLKNYLVNIATMKKRFRKSKKYLQLLNNQN